MTLDALVRREEINAGLGWAATVVMCLGVAESFLTTAYLWGGLSLVIIAVTSLPAIETGDLSAMVPWPLPAIAALAIVLRSAGLFPEIAGYVVIASLALLVVVELDVFTTVEFSRRFAIVFAVMTTMALQAFWIIAQFYSDRWFGTVFLRSQTELQWDIVLVTVTSAILGGMAEWYFKRFEPVGSAQQVPSE